MLYLKKLMVVCGLLTLAALANPAYAQQDPSCGPAIKSKIAEILSDSGYHNEPQSKESQQLQQELYKEFQDCAGDGQLSDDFHTNANGFCGKVSYAGSTYYERMRCCGYDPQKKLFACPVEVLQPFGFGAAPFPGSYEYVLTCIGNTPVAFDRVHLANAVSGSPIWHFAVIAKARERLAKHPLDGSTLRARSILSWNLAPTDCNYQPIWGNVLDYKIRLDP